MLEFTKEWCMAMALREKGEPINAGCDIESTHKETYNSFMALVCLLRRKNGLTIKNFSKKADIELYDALQIESNPNYSPSARTVYKISTFFNIQNRRMLELAGITEKRGGDLNFEMLPFAACTAGNTEKLSKEELFALEQLVSIIAKQK